MKLYLACCTTLLVMVLITVVVGRALTEQRWGAEGIESLNAVAIICLAAALLGAIPMGIVAPRWPTYIGQAVLGGTVLRLLLTMALGLGYQTLWNPHLPSFLFWAVVFYLLLLTVETGFGIAMIKRFYTAPAKTEGASK